MADNFANYQPGLNSPARNAAAVTTDDANDLATTARALYIGGTGNLKITTPGGTAVTFNSVPVGIFPVSAARVWQNGTTATNIVALW